MLTIKNPETYDWSNIPLEDCLFGNAMDTLMTHRLYSKLRVLLAENERLHLFEKLISPGLKQFSESEYIGIDIDEKALYREDKNILDRLQKIELELKELAGNTDLNINSGLQLNDLFFNSDTGLKLYPVKYTDKNKPCLDSDALTNMLEIINKEILKKNAAAS